MKNQKSVTTWAAQVILFSGILLALSGVIFGLVAHSPIGVMSLVFIITFGVTSIPFWFGDTLIDGAKRDEAHTPWVTQKAA